MAHYGGRVSHPCQYPCRLDQRQHADWALGATDGIQAVPSGDAPRARTGFPPPITTLFPAHSTPHRGRGQCPHRHSFAVVWFQAPVGMQDRRGFTHTVYLSVPIAKSGLLDRLSPFQKNWYAIDFHAADDIYRHGRVASSTSTRTNIGPIGHPTLRLWDWTHTFKRQSSPTSHARSPASPPEYAPDTTDEATKLQLQQLLALSQPLARRSPWPQAATPQNWKTPKS